MPVAATRHFGTREYQEESLIRLPHGMPGYEPERCFLLLQVPDQYPLVYLQSVATPNLCFVGLPVLTIERNYALSLTDEDSRTLGVSTRPKIGTDVLCLALIAVEANGASANLMAPVVVNLNSRTAAQCINASPDYSHRHSLLQLQEAVTR